MSSMITAYFEYDTPGYYGVAGTDEWHFSGTPGETKVIKRKAPEGFVTVPESQTVTFPAEGEMVEVGFKYVYQGSIFIYYKDTSGKELLPKALVHGTPGKLAPLILAPAYAGYAPEPSSYSLVYPKTMGTVEFIYRRLGEEIASGASGAAVEVEVVKAVKSTATGGKDVEIPGTYYETQESSSIVVPTTNITPTFNDTYNTGCYYLLYSAGSLVGTWSLPVYPLEFTDNNEADFTSTSILGRSVAYQTYGHSSRSVSFTLTLHEEITARFAVSNTNSSGNHSLDIHAGKYSYVRELIARIQSACYPEYSENEVRPPEVEFIIGSQFSIRGILTSCSAVWKPPYIDGRYVCCDLSLGVTETTGPYSMSDVGQLQGRRVNH